MSEEKKHLPANPDDACDASKFDSGEIPVYYQAEGKRWWIKGDHGEWIPRDRYHVESELMNNGLSSAANTDEKLSKVREKIRLISRRDYVQYAAPLAGWPAGFHTIKRTRVLVTESPAVVIGKKGDCSTLHRIFEASLAGGDRRKDDDSVVIDQRPYFFKWWRHALESLNEAYPTTGLALTLAGDPGCGKTLIKSLIATSFGDRECSVYNFFAGKDRFNGEFLQNETWFVDDEASETDKKARRAFAAELKKTVASPVIRFRGIQKDAVNFPTFKRLIICLNVGEDSLKVLPDISDDVAGKISLFYAYNSKLFDRIGVNSVKEKKALSAVIEQELPCFIYWLLHEFEPDDELDGRFGCKEFHHPLLLQSMFEISPEQTLLAQMNRSLEPFFSSGFEDYWIGTTTELLAVLSSDASPLSIQEKKYLPAVSTVGKYLRRLEVRFPKRFRFVKKSNASQWTIFPSGGGSDTVLMGGMTDG